MCIRDRSGGAVAPPVRPLAPEAPAGLSRGQSPPGEAASSRLRAKAVFGSQSHGQLVITTALH
eukprot:14553600-Alexandrium_andersonii.AAC.1